MTDQEQNMVNRMKIAIARMILDIDDDLILDAIKKVLSEKGDKEMERSAAE